jgi:hypothetical protein
MEKKEVEQHVKNILGRTFDILKDAYWAQTEKSISVNKPKTHLIFPLKKSDDSNRISEQELRFVFVEQLNEEIKGISTDGKKSEEWDVYYSVETPTYYNYSFGDKPKDIICYKAKKEGRSGNIDLTIHDNKGKRIALIEFKFDNVTEHAFKKDFEKLHEEQDEKNKDFDPLRLFVLMLNSFKENTKSSIRDAKISIILPKIWTTLQRIYYLRRKQILSYAKRKVYGCFQGKSCFGGHSGKGDSLRVGKDVCCSSFQNFSVEGRAA